jgi:hypothetical protein
VDLTSCSSSITDKAIQRIMTIVDELHSLVLRPPASPPHLTFALLQALAAQGASTALKELVLQGCGGLLANTPKHLRPHVSDTGVRCRLPALLSFRSVRAKTTTPLQTAREHADEQARSAASSQAACEQAASEQPFALDCPSVFADWGVCQDVFGRVEVVDPITCHCTPSNAAALRGAVALVLVGTLHPQPSTLNPQSKPSTLNPKP